jgi:signal transduction histidine kinase
MADFGELLTAKIDTIVERWIEAVQQDRQIETTQELSYEAVRDSLPKVLEALSTVLSQAQENDVQTLVDASLEHGVVRAEQGFEPSEIAQEYRLLRSIIFSTLEADFLTSTPVEILRAVRLIDAVVDEAIARCFDSYTAGRLKELRQLQSQLKLTNQELTRLVRTSQTNLSQLAHELKTPLTSIIGYSDLFLRQQRQNNSLKNSVPNLESIERVLQGGRLLLRLINDTLEISRYEAGKMLLQPNRTDVSSLINTIMEMVEPLAAAKQLQLVVNTDRAPQSVLTDPLRLQQILTNLLSNAIRYTESGTIHVTCETGLDQQWTIAVTDPGMGIEPEDQAHIFDPYFRGTLGEQSLVKDGTGLGLAIVPRLVELLQGKIELVSQVGVGSTFTVTLPLELHLAVSS